MTSPDQQLAEMIEKIRSHYAELVRDGEMRLAHANEQLREFGVPEFEEKLSFQGDLEIRFRLSAAEGSDPDAEIGTRAQAIYDAAVEALEKLNDFPFKILPTPAGSALWVGNFNNELELPA